MSACLLGLTGLAARLGATRVAFDLGFHLEIVQFSPDAEDQVDCARMNVHAPSMNYAERGVLTKKVDAARWRVCRGACMFPCPQGLGRKTWYTSSSSNPTTFEPRCMGGLGEFYDARQHSMLSQVPRSTARPWGREVGRMRR